ncbi:MAG: hypothetical protein QXX35_03965 [Desulfurococcaceae archaeon]
MNRGEKVFIKKYGYCVGLKCIEKDTSLECIIPNKCVNYGGILGIEKKHLVYKLINNLVKYRRKNYLEKFSFIYSSLDKVFIFITIFLSRNTDYYRNTVKWIKFIIEKNCLSNPFYCVDYIKSYQYRELTYLLSKTSLSNILNGNEIRQLLCLKGFGLKSINAYLLHTYGYTKYAPIDRYYIYLLNRISLKNSIPNKIHCLKNELNCIKCSLSNSCLYSSVYNKFGEFNGIIQSMNYVYNRLKRIIDSRIKITPLEEKILGYNYDKYIVFIEEFEEFIDLLTSVDRLSID